MSSAGMSKTAMVVSTAVLLLSCCFTGRGWAVECGFIMKDNCDTVCSGRRVLGCKSCGVLCEECACGESLYPDMVCCHMKGANCESTGIPDAFQWITSEECNRFWGGMGEKTCPKEKCGK